MASPPGDAPEPISTGCPPLDKALARAGGITRGSLLEYVNGSGSSTATSLALLAAQEAGRAGGAIVLVDRARTFYPPAAAAWGIAMDRVVMIHPANEKDELWALDQALRCSHVAAAVGWPQRIDSITFRRFQLAVERSGCLGVMVRPTEAMREPSWADFRMSVSPLMHQDQRSPSNQQGPTSSVHRDSRCWRLQLKILKCRGNVPQKTIKLQVDDRTGEIHEAHASHMATQLAHSKIRTAQKRASA